MQQLERYFGFRVTLGKSVTSHDYKSHMKAINTAFAKSGIAPESAELYVCQIRIDAVSSHFDRSPVYEKLATMEIHLAVNKRDRDEERIYFLNDRVNHTLTDGLQPRASKFDLRYTVRGAFFEKTDHLHEIVYVVVSNSVKPKDRKLRVKFLATPTAEFGRKLVNVKAASTHLELELDPRIQLRFDI
jgi:hypothetical protein